jgi:hypothetical protein
LDKLDFDSVNVEEASWLERPFEECEVHDVVKGMNNEKVASPIGFFFGVLPSMLGGDQRRYYGGLP